MKPIRRQCLIAWMAVATLVCLSAHAGELVNLSTRGSVGDQTGRGSVGTGENVLIGGIIITGQDVSKRVMFRATGPSMKVNGAPVAGALQDPILDLYDSSHLLATNDDWRYGPELEIEASKLQPVDDYESAVIDSLKPGQYTAIVHGYAHSTGIAVVEAFDLEAASAARLAEISTRANVGAGDNVLIGGFIIANSATKVLLRAIGPELSQFHVSHPLQNPTLELRDVNGNLIEANDDWKTDNRQAIQDTGAAPKDDRESAIVRTLDPGQYTAVVQSKDSTPGVGLVEIYRLP